MFTVEKFFANMFNQPNISRRHLLNFALDFLQRLINANTNKQFDVMIAFLTPLIDAFDKEVSS